MQNFAINVAANHIFVYPETYEETKLILDFALDAKLEIVNFDNKIVYQSSPLYLQEIQHKRKLSHNYSVFSLYSYETQNLTSNHLSASEISEFRNYSRNKCLNNEGYLKLVENKFVSNTRKSPEERSKIKLKQKLLED
jgi:hypothetical protein